MLFRSERAALGVIEHVRATPGMDLASKGLLQHAYAVRGERGSVSGALLTLTDFRYAELPSLALNIPYLVPVNDEDLERIEVVRGPGAALYGPGADRGVLHFITRSPFESPGGVVTISSGSRSLQEVRGRWAGMLGRRAAVRFSASYVKGTDWPFADSVENANRDAAILAGADPDTLRIGRRDPGIERAAGEARLDWRPTTHTEIVTTAGVAEAIRAVDLGGDVGSVQGRHWQYRFAQVRLRERRLHLNLFYDGSSTGDSYLLRTGATLVDESRVAGAQLQHGATLGRFDLLYGADWRWTDPRTGGTIHGANEADDQITETGAYLHAASALGPRTDLVAALRVDHHDRLDDVVLSPRLGVVFRPSVAHALRLTVNRGFSSPDANSLFLDIVQDSLPNGLPYAVRASSLPKGGYTFRRDCGGLCMHSPFGATGPLPIDAASAWAGVFAGIPAPAPGQVATYLAYLDTGTPVAAADVHDIPAMKRTITTSLEGGWRAMFGRRFGLSLDVYVNRVEEVRGARYVATPSAFLDSASLATYLRNYLSPGQADAAAEQVKRLPIGTVSPQETPYANDLLVLSRQGGEYTVWGMDVGIDVPLTRQLAMRGSASLLSRNEASVAGTTYLLNVPRHKAGLGLTWRKPGSLLQAGAEARWIAGFPVNTGVYVGDVKAYSVLDGHLTVPLSRRLALDVQANNVFGHRHQEFVGAPFLERLIVTRLRAEF